MKKVYTVICILLILSLLCGCGRVFGVKQSVAGTNELHREGDIYRAMGVVRRFFRFHFHGCKLEGIVYEESRNLDRGNSRNEIELTCSFTVDERNTDGPLEPGETYENYSFELERGFLGGWKLVGWGYC